MPRLKSPLTLEFILLGFLDRCPVHGYDLFKQITRLEGVGLVWHVKQSQLYALLEKLEREKLVSAHLQPTENTPPRKEYRITAAGRQKFKAWRAAPVLHGREVRQEFLARLYFARADSPQTGLALIDRQTRACHTWLEMLKAEHDQLAVGGNHRYEQIVYRYRITQTEALLDWLAYCRADLEDIQNP